MTPRPLSAFNGLPREAAIEQLEAALTTYPGALILITHDPALAGA